jgi:hypothetical protein
MSETATKAATKAATTAAKRAATQAANEAASQLVSESVVEKGTEAAISTAVKSRDIRVAAVTFVGTTVGLFVVQQGRAYLAKRRLQAEIDAATSENGSRESRA